MKIISLPRGGGKTSILLKLSAEKGYVIVTRDEESCKHLLKRAEESKITIPQPISYWDFLRKGKNFDYRKKYVIDNLDSMFEANADVVLATVSSVEEGVFSLQTIF